MLGITVPKAESAAVVPNLLGQRRVVQHTMSGYALQLVAAAHAEPELVAAVRRALRPSEDLRDAQARRASSRGGAGVVEDEAGRPGGEVVTPSTPVPVMAHA